MLADDKESGAEGGADVPSQKIDELLRARLRSHDVWQIERFQNLVSNALAFGHVGRLYGRVLKEANLSKGTSKLPCRNTASECTWCAV